MNSILNRNPCKRFIQLAYYFAKRNASLDFHYDLTQDLTVTHYKRVLILGINLPDASNSLNDSVLSKLNEALKDFNVNDEHSVAVLHGLGGNFCTGIQESASIEKAEELLKTMKELKKPTLASLTGTTKFFGFQLAMMCDIRLMESNALFGLGHKQERERLFPMVRERLLQVTGLATALEIALASAPLNNSECFAAGLVNKWADIGTGLGRSLNFAGAIAKHPLDEIIQERSLMYSCMKNREHENTAVA